MTHQRALLTPRTLVQLLCTGDITLAGEVAWKHGFERDRYSPQLRGLHIMTFEGSNGAIALFTHRNRTLVGMTRERNGEYRLVSRIRRYSKPVTTRLRDLDDAAEAFQADVEAWRDELACSEQFMGTPPGQTAAFPAAFERDIHRFPPKGEPLNRLHEAIHRTYCPPRPS